MPPNDSSTGGYLAPAGSPAPLEDDALVDFLQAVVVGITGLDGTLVRPRWQAEPPNLPAVGTNWAAVGIASQRPDTFAMVEHDPTGNGADALQRHEEFDLLCSFYGPNGGRYANVLRDGLSVAQNREVLTAAAMGLVGVSSPTRAPELIKNTWISRVDLTVTIRRQIRRTYPVLHIVSSGGSIETAVTSETFES